MRYFSKLMGKDVQDRLYRSMDGGFRRVVKSKKLIKGYETFQAIRYGGGESVVEQHNWPGYVQRSINNDSYKSPNAAEIYYDKDVVSSDGGVTSTESVLNFITPEILSKVGKDSSIESVDITLSCDNVVQSLEKLSVTFREKYSFGLKALSFGLARGLDKSWGTYKNVLKTGSPTGDASKKWDDKDIHDFLDYVGDLMEVEKEYGNKIVIDLIYKTRMKES